MKNLEGDYYVDNHGNIYSNKSGVPRILKNRIQSAGYSQVILCNEGIKKSVLVHRIVAMFFIPNDDIQKKYINHKDGNKQNNHFENLEWCSARENNQHAYKNGLKKGGRKLLPQNIIEIRNSDKKTKELSIIYSVSRPTIYRIKNKQIWKKI